MRRLSRAAVVVAFILLPVTPAHTLPARDIAGVAVHPWRMELPQKLERTFADVAATGARWARVDLRWSQVEPHGPSLASGSANWAEMDAVVAAAQRHGVELLPIVAYVPDWASNEHERWAYPDAGAFEAFFEAALRRYPQIGAWELWNEPNFGVFAKPAPDPAGFVEFLRSAHRVRNRVGSRAKLISGGLAPGMQIDIDEWVEEMARRGGLELIDGLGVHPYSPREPDDPQAWMMRLESLHRRLSALGHSDLKLWLTEFGAPVSPVASGWGPELTEEEQAARLRLAFALATRLAFVEHLTWFEYRDSCPDLAVADCHFGLVRHDLSPRPAFHALKEVTSGSTIRLRPRITLALRRSRHSRRAPQAVTVRGTLLLPGSPAAAPGVTLRLLRRGLRPKTMRVAVREGAFRVRLHRHGRRRWTIEARYPGSRAYEPAVARSPQDIPSL